MMFLITMVMFSISLAQQTEQCKIVPDSQKVDCYPGGGSNQYACAQRGCCWKSGTDPNIPFCYYPGVCLCV